MALLHALLVLAICRQVAFDAAPVGTTEFISSYGWRTGTRPACCFTLLSGEIDLFQKELDNF